MKTWGKSVSIGAFIKGVEDGYTLRAGMSTPELGIFLSARVHESRLKKENIGVTPARSRGTMDPIRQGPAHLGTKPNASYQKVARPLESRRAFKDIANVGWKPWTALDDEEGTEIKHIL